MLLPIYHICTQYWPLYRLIKALNQIPQIPRARLSWPLAPSWLSCVLSVLLGFGLASTLGVALAQTTAETDTYEYKLENGLRIILKQDRRAPTVAQMVWYRAGSIDEFNGTTGVAHVLEHMMFKQTKKLKAGEFSRTVAALGGRENAFTSKDYTAYYQQVEKSHLAAVMALEAERMANLMLTQQEFEKEIQVVMEERRLRTEDQAQAVLNEQLSATAFIASPQRVPVIGWMDDLKSMTYLDAQAWYQRWYAPNNAVLIIAGDAEPNEVKRLAKKYFGPIKARSLPPRKPQNEPTQQGMRTTLVKAPAETASLTMAYKVPILRDVEHDQDVYALMVLAAVLDGYSNSRLSRHLVREQRVADSIGADYSPIARGPQLFYLSGVPAQGHTIDQLEQAIRDELALLIKSGVDEAELKRVTAQLVAGRVFKRDSVFGQAMEIGVAEMSGISWQSLDKIIEKLYTVTPAQVQAVAAKYLRDDQLTIARLFPLPLGATTMPKPLLEDHHH